MRGLAVGSLIAPVFVASRAAVGRWSAWRPLPLAALVVPEAAAQTRRVPARRRARRCGRCRSSPGCRRRDGDVAGALEPLEVAGGTAVSAKASPATGSSRRRRRARRQRRTARPSGGSGGATASARSRCAQRPSHRDGHRPDGVPPHSLEKDSVPDGRQRARLIARAPGRHAQRGCRREDRLVIDPLGALARHGEKPDYAGPLSFGGAPYTQDPAAARRLRRRDRRRADRRPRLRPPGHALRPAGDPRRELPVRARTWRPGGRVRGAAHRRLRRRAGAARGSRASHAAIEETVGEVLEAGAVPIVLGGDHSIAEPDIAACAAATARSGLVHFDTHTDTGTRGLRRRGVARDADVPARRSGAVDPSATSRSACAATGRASASSPGRREQGITSILMHEVRDEGIDAAVERAVARRRRRAGLPVRRRRRARSRLSRPGTGRPSRAG